MRTDLLAERATRIWFSNRTLILGALNMIHHAIMWRAIINASVLVPRLLGTFILSRTSPHIFGSYPTADF